MFSVASVCLSLRLSVCNTITVKSSDVESLVLVCGNISNRYWSGSHMKVMGQGQGHSSKQARNSLFPQFKTSVGNNFGSIEDRA